MAGAIKVMARVVAKRLARYQPFQTCAAGI